MEMSSDLPYVHVSETIGHAPDKQLVAAKLRLMAGYILKNTTQLFICEKSGAQYAAANKVVDFQTLKMQSLFNDWKYWNGVNHMALNELSNVLDESLYRNYGSNNYAFFFKHLPLLEKLYDSRTEGASGHQFFRMDRLDDFGAMAAGLFEVLETDQRPAYLSYLEKCMDYIAHKQDRLEDGTFCRNRFGYTSLWGDDLYMSVPFLVRAWRFTGQTSFLEDAVNQVLNFNKHLFRKEMGLYYHYRIMQEGAPGVAHWGRANGWMVLAKCQLLEALPLNHPQRDQLVAILKEHLLGIARYQTANGLWRQLLDKSDSFLESSCTAMFTYGMAKAVNMGWINDIYTSVALRGWEGLVKECIAANGYLDKVTTGFNFKQDLPFYYNVPIEPDGDHGIGTAIYAGIEIYKFKALHRDCVWC